MQSAVYLFLTALAVTMAASSVWKPTWGVNTHFIVPLAGETAMLSRAFTAIRTDITWANIEITPGVYTYFRT